MAIARPSLITTLSGKLAGVEYASTHNGLILKKTKPPRALSSPRASNWHNVWSQYNTLWNHLPADEILAWEALAPTVPQTNRLGARTYLTPHALFMSLAIDRTNLPLWPNTNPLPIASTPGPAGLSIGLYPPAPLQLVPTPTEGFPDNTAIVISVARFRPRDSKHLPRSWIHLTPYPLTPNPADWESRFLAQGVTFQAYESIALKVRYHTHGSWPSPWLHVYHTF